MGAHKQIVNRLLEPFQHIHVVVTATEWDNFFALRHHPKAQPEFQELAMKMQAAYASNVPKLVAFGDWHLPYTDESDGTVRRRIIKSAASCARVSYTNHEGKESTEEEDSNLYLRLVTADPPHMSPVEHQAMAVPGDKFYANFRGWRQHRYDLERNQVS
jgi:thymidylate synthase ThyX